MELGNNLIIIFIHFVNMNFNGASVIHILSEDFYGQLLLVINLGYTE